MNDNIKPQIQLGSDGELIDSVGLVEQSVDEANVENTNELQNIIDNKKDESVLQLPDSMSVDDVELVNTISIFIATVWSGIFIVSFVTYSWHGHELSDFITLLHDCLLWIILFTVLGYLLSVLTDIAWQQTSSPSWRVKYGKALLKIFTGMLTAVDMLLWALFSADPVDSSYESRTKHKRG